MTPALGPSAPRRRSRHDASSVSGFAQQQPAQRPERLPHAVRAPIATGLLELALDEPAVVRGHPGLELPGERRLADAGRPRHQNDTTLSIGRGVEPRRQGADLPVAAHGSRRRDESQGIVALAQHEPLVPPLRQVVAQATEIVRQSLRALVPPVGLLLQQPEDDFGQRRRYVRVEDRGRLGNRGQLGPHHGQRVTPSERRLPGDQLVQRGPERVQVGALVHGPPRTACLLGRHVRERADDVARQAEAGQLLRRRRGDVEVDQRRSAGRCVDHHVGRVDVAVDDAAAVHAGERDGQLEADLDRDRDRHRQIERGERLAAVAQDEPTVDGGLGGQRHGVRDVAEPPDDVELVAQPLHRTGAPRLLHDHRPAAGQRASHDPRPVAGVHHLHVGRVL